MVSEISSHGIVVGGDLQGDKVLLHLMPFLVLLLGVVLFQAGILIHVLEYADDTIARLRQVGNLAC